MKALVPLQVVKPLTYPRASYGTRHLQPGDVFTARSERDHKLLLATKKVREVRPSVDLPPPPPGLVEKVAPAAPSDDMPALRAEYERVIGRRPFFGWGADELRRRIAAGPDA